ncbi:MAG: hypothetical protein EOO38_08705 [Cytophagaceae bacterium]|nr:MAG: hypothetical protein EOO38_08705 [Cytophagaceae bacterium]
MIAHEPVLLERAIVTVVSPGFEELLSNLLRSLERVGNQVPVVVFAIDASFDTVANWPGVIALRCYSRGEINANVKGVIYSCARWVKAKHILSIESDVVAVGSLEPLWNLLEETHGSTFAGCRPNFYPRTKNTIQDYLDIERGYHAPVDWLGDAKFLFNGGVVAGNALAWRQLDERIQTLGARAYIFIEGGMASSFKDEMVMNWAVNFADNVVELHAGWNATFYSNERGAWVQTHRERGKTRYTCNSGPVRLLHFMGSSRQGNPSLMDEFLKEIDANHADEPQPSTPRFAVTRECRRCQKVSSTASDFVVGSDAIERSKNGYISARCSNCARLGPVRAAPTYPVTKVFQYECVDCSKIQGECSCWVPSSKASEPNERGYYDALCTKCEAIRNGVSPEQLIDVLKEQAFEE